MKSRVAATNCLLKGNRQTTTFCALLVIVLAPLCRVDATDKMDLAIQRLESLGGEIKRDETLPGHPVTEVTFSQCDFDENARVLRLFTNLTTLNFVHAEITGAGLNELSRLKSLKSLGFDETPITQAGLKQLGGLTLKLQSLNLSTSGKITDAGLDGAQQAGKPDDTWPQQ